jgi:hypothetical protein
MEIVLPVSSILYSSFQRENLEKRQNKEEKKVETKEEKTLNFKDLVLQLEKVST